MGHITAPRGIWTLVHTAAHGMQDRGLRATLQVTPQASAGLLSPPGYTESDGTGLILYPSHLGML